MEKLIVSSAPHIHAKHTTQSIMRDVLIALSPAAVAAVVFFGWKALGIILVCVAASVLSELCFNLICKKTQTVSDLSAAVTGLILALCLPTTAELWQCALGSVFAIVVVKCLFGGIGCNFANPAATARVFLLVAFSASIAGGTATAFADPDVVASATPLEIIKFSKDAPLPSLLDMFLGNRMGAIGETCSLALIVGGIYLIVRKIIHWEIPVIYIGTVFVLSLIIKQDLTVALYEILGGGVLIAAFFMITDYVSTPINKGGKMLFALGCGIITVLIRFWGAYPEGVSFAILLMNIVAPYLTKLCVRRPFGKVGK
ncbi:MAG: RnfABCDGE type electron transport complex subunit D [Clostridia bacterium]|nr:RnfABCDGE type electron transport complex subunit D [Clostridia bacterium]